MEQDNKILLQQVENLKAKQAIDQSSLQELKEKVEDKLNHLVHPVTLTAPIYPYTDKSQALTSGALGGQQAFGGLGIQPDPALYFESQGNGTGLDTNPEEVCSLLNSSAETLPIPKTPDTSFKSKQRNTPPVVGAAQVGTRLELEERKQPNPRGLEQEGDNVPAEARPHTGSGKDTQPLSEPHLGVRGNRQPALGEGAWPEDSDD